MEVVTLFEFLSECVGLEESCKCGEKEERCIYLSIPPIISPFLRLARYGAKYFLLLSITLSVFECKACKKVVTFFVFMSRCVSVERYTGCGEVEERFTYLSTPAIISSSLWCERYRGKFQM